MSTLYEIFKISENASQDEIDQAYENLLERAESLPQTEELTKHISQIKIAYGILSTPEKRKKYDLDLANKRAEELLKNVQVKHEVEQEIKQEEKIEDIEKRQVDVQNQEALFKEQILKKKIEYQINNAIARQQIEEQNRKLYEKQIKKQFKKEKRLAKKQAEMQREMQMQAYGDFLQKQGYKVKYPWTWPRVKRLFISMTVVIIVCTVLWQIPYVRKNLISLYEENFIIKILVDIILSIFNAIASLLKRLMRGD